MVGNPKDKNGFVAMRAIYLEYFSMVVIPSLPILLLLLCVGVSCLVLVLISFVWKASHQG